MTLSQLNNLAQYESKVWQRHEEGPLILLRPIKKGTTHAVPSRPSGGDYLPMNTTQSCDAVPMKSNIGSDSHALVRDAIKACWASSGAAGGPPCSAAMLRLLAGQIIPQTLSNMRMP